MTVEDANLMPDASLFVEEHWSDESARALQRLSASPQKPQ